MSQDANAVQKSDQIAHRFFTKTVLVADHARNIYNQQTREDAAAKVDRWFNIETPDNESYKDQLRIYRSLSQLGASPPPLFFRVFLTVPGLTANQVLVQHPPNSSRTRVEPTPSYILLEAWSLTFRATTASSSQLSSPTTSSTSTSGEVSLATVYKHIMSVIRSMYTMLRVLPAWRIIKRLRRRPGATRQNGQLGIELRVQAHGGEGVKYLDFDTPLAPGTSPLPTATHTFAPITHPMGVFSLAVTYLTNPHFEIDTLEALLSSRFLSMDAGPEFTPTLARGTTRDSASMSGSPTSLALRTSLPRSPPQDRAGGGANVADRFVYSAGAAGAEASGSRASFPSTSPRGRGAALPPVSVVQRSISAQTPGTGTSHSIPGSGQGSLSSESRLSREDGREGGLSSLSRIRKESTGMGRGSDLPSSPSPVLIRRPSTTVNPFKSSTLSSGSPSLHSNSPSFRHASPLPSLPSVPAGRPAPVPLSPTNARASSSRVGTEVDFPSSPVSGPGTGYRSGSSPFPPLRPSPPSPFVPSSLGDRRFPSTPATAGLSAGGEGTEPIATPPRRKRYSSSFGYRYVAGASDGSAGSGEKGKEPERPSPSYLGSQLDDDDLRAFVQEIDNSKPLGRGTPSSLGNLALGHERERTLSEAGLAGRAVLAGANFPNSSSRPSFVSRTSSSDNTRHHRTSSDSVGVVGLATGTPVRRDTTVSPSLPSSPGRREKFIEPARSASVDPGTDSAIESKLREMTDAFQASMGKVARRPSTVAETSETSTSISSTASTSTAAYTTASERERERTSVLGPSPFSPYNPGPGAAHLRMPSYNAAIGVPNPRSTRRTVTTPSLSSSSSAAAPLIPHNEVPGSGLGSGLQSASGSGTGHLASVWDNRRVPGRPRTDSAGSGASNISVLERDRERARLFYGQGHVSRGSVGSVGGASHGTGGSVGSEEVVGRMEMDR